MNDETTGAPQQNAASDDDVRAIELDVICDFSCPWSYIGKKRLDAALSMLEAPVKVTYYPYLLAADIPPGGIPRKDWLAKAYGTPVQVRKVLDEIEKAGKLEGITFNFDAIKVQPYTIDAHRLMRWAQEQGKASEMADRLFKLYFEEGEDIGDIDVLAQAAADIGLMDVFKARKMLESELDVDEVWKDIQEAHKLGVKRIPAFIIARKYAILGAEDAVTLFKTLQVVQLEAEEAN
ncbi:DsbA family protein [Thermopetrobacter sp. TC1]|uniref:DsbA family oxidoreductase n=1 Tax=Thermopetrobacter sp. TC1 TaxID=1495045 RepID=UPI0018CF5EC8|nr:DsbA family oxidoreductase [Thermopetrobacter sp. TC1]